MDEKSMLVIDLGTSKVHVNIIRLRDGKLICNETEAYPWIQTEENRTEILSSAIWEAAQNTCGRILDKISGKTELVGITFSWFGAELVTLDKNKEEVFPLIVSFDARADAESEELRKMIPPERERLVGRGGLTAESNPAKMLWLKRHAPERYRKIRYVATIEQYFYNKLGLTFCGEHSMIQTLQYHTADGKILDDILQASETPAHCLDYPVADGDRILGEITKFGRVELPDKLPVLYGGHDCILSQLGSGVIPSGNGILGDVSGTYDLMGFFRRKEQMETIEPDCVNTPIKDVYSYMYGAPTGAILSERVCRLWGECDGDLLTELFENAVFDGEHGGLWKLPEWEILRSDKSVLDTYGEKQVFESLVEEITFELRASYDMACRKNKDAFRTVRIGGGASKSKSWLQLKADVFGISAELTDNKEVSSMGAAIIGAVVLGYYPDYETAVLHMVKVSERYEPKKTSVYQSLYKIWRECTGKVAMHEK